MRSTTGIYPPPNRLQTENQSLEKLPSNLRLNDKLSASIVYTTLLWQHLARLIQREIKKPLQEMLKPKIIYYRRVPQNPNLRQHNVRRRIISSRRILPFDKIANAESNMTMRARKVKVAKQHKNRNKISKLRLDYLTWQIIRFQNDVKLLLSTTKKLKSKTLNNLNGHA